MSDRDKFIALAEAFAQVSELIQGESNARDNFSYYSGFVIDRSASALVL
jgi:hypothetical protein